MPRLPTPAACALLCLAAATTLPRAAAFAGGRLVPDALAVEPSSLASYAATSALQARRNRIVIAHAVVGALVFLVFMPGALLAGRWLRRFRWWLYVHAALNSLAAAGVVVAFGLGYYRADAYGHWGSVHQRLGLGLLLLVLLQALGGLAAHFTKTSSLPHPRPTVSRASSPVRLAHLVCGLTIAGLGFAQVHTGIPLWNKYVARSTVQLPSWLYGLMWAIAGVEIAAYLGGWVWEAVEVRRGVAEAARGARRGSGEALVGQDGGGTGSPGSAGSSGMLEVGSVVTRKEA